ncbi:hypothetical protein HWQ46_17005 [Shewanella sp. D64]|uniref:hypothetical protein n=1 Tax=unclassified Shewanella TaxID=196818 RepID=UPI0022BA2849|nr:MULTISPECIES: hypothetical protein [unclassified Shewanella]MEC4727247.1 hypothetical protein [Shewanella sp. D64]MEC4739402.1 hypothetical protein [Shewanella sp. E94]WBJ96731.1 hypothetical protein HWQ47_06340 [Shewanella sp. MTB7]
MKNIPLQVNLEGQDSRVDTDWLAIMAILKKRGLDQSELANIYLDISAGMRVTTRGLSLAQLKPNVSLNGIIRETRCSEYEYAGMTQA